MENTQENSSLYRSNLEQVSDQLDALPDEEVVDNPRVDSYQAAAIAEAGAKKAAPFEGELGARFGEASRTRIGLVLALSGAVRQADAEVQSTGSVDIEALHDGLRNEYDKVEAKVVAAAKAGAVDRRLVADVHDVQGYEATAKSALTMAKVARDHLPAIQTVVVLTEDELVALERDAKALLTALTERDHGVAKSPARDRRNRAITLLIKEHDELRRDMTWLRWHAGDVDELVPSIWSGRGRKGKGDEEPEVITPTPAPAPTPNDGGPFTG